MSRKKRKSKSGEDLVRKGLKQFKDENYSEASKSFEKAARESSDPKSQELAAEACFRNALSLYETGRINYAISELHRAIQNNPDKPIYHYHLGLAYHRKGRRDKAILCYIKAIQREEDNDRFKYHLALACLDVGDVKSANEMLEEISDSEKYAVNLISDQMMALILIKQGNYKEALEVLQDSDDEYAHFLRGVAYIYLGKRRDAKSSLRTAIDGGFDNAIAHYHLGVAYAMSDNKFSATKSWETAIKADPDIINLVKSDLMNVYRELAAEYVLEKDALPKAVRIWKKMLKLEPENTIAKNNLVRFYFLEANDYVEKDDLSRAISNWNNIIELEPDNTDALHNIALAYDKTGRTFDAIEQWEELAKAWEKHLKITKSEQREQIKKQLAVAYRHLGNSYINVDQVGNAAKNLRNATRYDSEDVDTTVQLAGLYAYMEQTKRAVREIKKALKLKPQDTELYNMLGVIYAEDGKTKQAIDAWLDAYRINPENKIIRKNLSMYTNEVVADFMGSGRAYRAIELLEDVIECMSDEANLHVLLGGIYLDEGNIVEAEEIFQRSIDINPDDGYTYAAIGKFYLRASEDKRSKEFFKKAMDRADDNPVVPLEIGRSYCLTNVPRKAKKYFDLAIEFDPTEDVFLNIIMELVEANATKMASQYIKKGIEVLSQPVPIILIGAMVSAEIGDYRQVDEYMELATDLAYESDDPRLIDMVEDIGFTISLSSMMSSLDPFDDDFDDEDWLDDDDEWEWF